MQHLLAAVQVLDEFRDAAGVFELMALRLAGFRVRGALVGKGNEQAFVQECQLAQALRKGIEVVFGDGENLFVREEVHLGAELLGSPGLLELRGRLALGVGLLPNVSVAPDFQIKLMA